MTDSANVALVRSICEPWAHGDFSRTDWANPDIEMVWVDGLNPRARRGLLTGEGGSYFAAFDDLSFEATEFRELDNERVLMLGRYRGHGKASGIDLSDFDAPHAAIFHVRGARVAKLVLYSHGEQALADLGLCSGGRG